jgi:hypothetical protein
MGNMISIGQGAGVAAAVAARHGILPREVNVRQVQEALVRMGVDFAAELCRR